MPRLPQLRVIIDSEPNTGRWNMAVDEALLDSAISSNVSTLRWYRWREPTISLGYFQKLADASNEPGLSPLPVVRRITGGGAILHDDELTYSVAIPSTQRLFAQPEELYDIVHSSLILGLNKLGYPAQRRGQTPKQSGEPFIGSRLSACDSIGDPRRQAGSLPDAEPFLCFARQDSHDVTLNGHKIIGSAQRRRRGAILQHGSLIQRASDFARHLQGLADLCPSELPVDLSRKLSDHVAQAISESCVESSLSELEIETAGRFCRLDRVDFHEEMK
jgi:lipoate-protein ligase A